MIDRPKRRARLALFWCGAFLIAFLGCASSHPSLKNDDLSVYRLTNDQPGHEFVKTESFLVPIGSVVPINGLEFEPGSSTLTTTHRMILQQVFNSIEEITENTVGDTNLARVAEYKQMKFEIRGYPDDFGNHDLNTSLAKQRANTVLEFLTYLGTPPRRLTATAALPSQSVLDRSGKNKRGKIEFIRKRISSP